jgi:two-component system, cell cycle sensor histidine kinase and response regulator CckA
MIRSAATGETILVVDDNNALRDLMETILVRGGYHVLTARDGMEALGLAGNTLRIDLLLSDLEMPAMRGEELAARFTRLHPATPVLFVSSADGPREAGTPFQFCAKPFTFAELRDSVRRALGTHPTFAV